MTVEQTGSTFTGVRLACDQPAPLSVNTDVDGRAEVRFTPTWFGASLVTGAQP